MTSATSTAVSPRKSEPHHRPPEVGDRFARYETLAQRFGTPFYVYEAERIEAQVALLRSFLPKTAETKMLYSFKANPLPSVAGLLHHQGCVADLTSSGEIAAAIKAGFDLGEALYGGPGKSDAELRFAIDAGVRNFSVESDLDLEALNAAVETSGADVRALLRINPLHAPKAKLAMSGVASQFGFEEEVLRNSGKAIVASSHDRVRICGIHIYWGTQIGDSEALLECFRQTITIAEELSEELEFSLDVVNLGGGFPWPYAHTGEGPDLSALSDGLAQLHRTAGAAADAQWWFESGRFLTSSSGTLVTKVMDLKLSKDEKQFLILDTGIHHLGGMAGLGRIPRFSIDLETAPDKADRPEAQVEVVGQLCTPLDCIGRRIKLPKPNPGDLLAIPNVGAYGPTASVIGFLSRPAPTEILVRGETILSAHKLQSGHAEL